MPSERRVIAFRPDEEEGQVVKALAGKYGVSMARILGIALRQMAEREGVKVERDVKDAEKK